MYVCLCKKISDNHVVEAFEAGHRDLDAVAAETGLGSGCGRCRRFTHDLLEELSDSNKDSTNV